MGSSGKTTVVTIDGPAGAGKSTVAKALAKQLKYFYLDTGAMYRALTLKALTGKTDLTDEQALAALARKTSIDFKEDPQKGLRVFLDGKDVSDAIRTQDVTNNTFYIARAPSVREVMVELQRTIGGRLNVVVEGRDVGTVVFPKAKYKFYLDADVTERSRRRSKELQEKGQHVEAAKLRQDIEERDKSDMTRTTGPLKKAADAVVIDSTRLSAQQVVDKMLEIIIGQNIKRSKGQR